MSAAMTYLPLLREEHNVNLTELMQRLKPLITKIQQSELLESIHKGSDESSKFRRQG